MMLHRSHAHPLPRAVACENLTSSRLLTKDHKVFLCPFKLQYERHLCACMHVTTPARAAPKKTCTVELLAHRLLAFLAHNSNAVFRELLG